MATYLSSWQKGQRPGAFRLVMFFDLVSLNLIMYGTNLVRFGVNWPNPVEMFVVSFSVATVVILFTLYFGGLYERTPRLGSPGYLPKIARLMIIAVGGVALIRLASSGFFRQFIYESDTGLPFPFVNLVVLVLLGSLGLVATRSIARTFQRQREGRPQVMLYGDPGDVAMARGQLGMSPQDFDVVATVTKPTEIAVELHKNLVTDVLLLSPQWLEKSGEALVYQLDEEGLNVLMRVRSVETMLGLKQISQVSGLPFIQLRPSALPRSQAHFKRLLDLGLVVVSMPVWLSVFLVIAVYQALAAGRPVFFVQERVGLGNRTFPMLKFRTMTNGAEVKTGPVIASAQDERVIPACKWVRATRMDELPQLFNVLAGHMSIVGPRPERPELIAGFGDGIPGYARRHLVRPGLTGLAQIYGRYDTKPEYKLGYDLHYAVNWSALLDAEIILRTVAVVLLRRG